LGPLMACQSPSRTVGHGASRPQCGHSSFSRPVVAYMVPMFFYEVPLGLWLLVKGVRAPTVGGGLAAG